MKSTDNVNSISNALNLEYLEACNLYGRNSHIASALKTALCACNKAVVLLEKKEVTE